MTVWRMHIVRLIPKATNTHSEYVIFIAVLLQQWSHERSSMLRYTYISCLFERYFKIYTHNFETQKSVSRVYFLCHNLAPSLLLLLLLLIFVNLKLLCLAVPQRLTFPTSFLESPFMSDQSMTIYSRMHYLPKSRICEVSFCTYGPKEAILIMAYLGQNRPEGSNLQPCL